jgi:catechol 2,3-dioxygenase-like lactoylglutathione lyase family enzyme
MDLTMHASSLPHDDPEASLAFWRDTLGFQPAVRGSRLRRPRSRGQPDPHPGAALSRPTMGLSISGFPFVFEPDNPNHPGSM